MRIETVVVFPRICSTVGQSALLRFLCGMDRHLIARWPVLSSEGAPLADVLNTLLWFPCKK